ncbi:C14orf166 [Bugula neritina]|uniref:C14orf166 n=1 Tax=Bugula neritina TaxID=10212 RepID=A0A7J7JW29_BUGNE|nr:C14orf166 [Bugula neritina]
MFARKLKALGYPSISNFDHSDQKKIQELVIWLEDQKIRHYKIEDRAALRKTSDISSWQRAFSKYLDDLSCPHSDRTNSPVTTDWLLGLAVRLVYGENPQRYRTINFYYVTEEAVKILRLLHIQNLRQLQSQINEALVIVQNVTANPKTDQRLGKIGR